MTRAETLHTGPYCQCLTSASLDNRMHMRFAQAECYLRVLLRI